MLARIRSSVTPRRRPQPSASADAERAHKHDRTGVRGSPDAKRLYDDLISRYNKLVRPVVNDTDALTVRIKLKLSQLIEVVGAKLSEGH
ncbi:hypothetical protein HPB52_008957 [Rhipicephalus sanguineus]|uniref:Neurotransmitter-gated ion-channel ligand-binding domain-containing protein n=1 Tax=Rhipicephalus sanguineus TaxID=34632 RepID=A0A9D4PQV2_RHISA|nr:hypothetical protein HPB52_008957 [Rhipicephalus sanguineus]